MPSRRARITYVAVTYQRSGTEQVILDLASHFVRAGHAVTILIPCLPALDGMAEETRLLGAGVERVGPLHSAGHNVLRNGVQLFQVLHRLRPDVVHFHVPWEPICFESVMAAVARVPVRIRTEHNPVLDSLGPVQRLKMRLLDRTFHRIVYLSEGNRHSHAVNLGRNLDRSIIIGNGIEPRAISADASTARRRAVRVGLNLPVEREIAVMLGTLERRKGPLDFVRAARVAANIHPTMHFAVVGDGSLRAECERLVGELGLTDRLHFLGHRSDVREFLGTFDLYVQPSHYEGLSVAMLEALAAGLPMVTTRVDGVDDVIPNEAGALRVNIGDYQRLGEAIARLASDARLRHSMASISQSKVLSEFTVEAMCDRYARLYRTHGAAV